MASVYLLYEEAVHIQDDIVMGFQLHATTARRNYFAATKIQSFYRGYVVRKEMKKLHRTATLIQKHVRGWLLRYHLPDILQEYYDKICLELYNKRATNIQACWKGYKVRKYEICIKDYMAEKEQIRKANEEMQRAISRLRTQGEQIEVINLDNEKIKVEKVLKYLFNRHHLLRTQQKSGVLSVQGDDELSELEKLLKSVSWADYMKNLRKLYNALTKEKEEYHYRYSDRKLRRQEELLRTKESSDDVHVEDEYLDKNIHDRPFVFSKKIEREPYERQITNAGKYKRVETKILRSFDKSMNISEKDFDLSVLKKTVKESDVPPYYIDFWFHECLIHNL